MPIRAKTRENSHDLIRETSSKPRKIRDSGNPVNYIPI